jgi:hypothetical protein
MDGSIIVLEDGSEVTLEDRSVVVVTASNSPMPLCVLTFQDVYGDPLPARTRVDIFDALDAPTEIPIASGFLGVGSMLTANLSPGTMYRVQYSGKKTPRIATLFIAAQAVTIVPDAYVSPWANVAGYALQQGVLFPANRAQTSELQPGGGLYVYFETLAAMLSQIDIFHRTVDAGLRLGSSAGVQINSWVADFIGDFPPLPGESEVAYKVRIAAWLQLPFGTLLAVAQVVEQFFTLNPDGSTYRVVFDKMSDPTRFAAYGLTSGQFGVLSNFETSAIANWWLGQGFLGQNSFVVGSTGSALFTASQTPTYADLDAKIKDVKMDGSVPVYISVVNEPPSSYEP